MEKFTTAVKIYIDTMDTVVCDTASENEWLMAAAAWLTKVILATAKTTDSDLGPIS